MKRSSRPLVALLALLWLATALRFHRLDAQSFWNDEGNSARLSERSVALIVEGAAGDVHPPLYYLMLSGWRGLLGQSEFALRGLSAFSGVLLVAATFRVGRRLVDHNPAAPLLAALLATISPALVYYSQEARMYELLALWAILTTYFLLRLLPLLEGRGRHRRPFLLFAAAYLVTSAAGLYTHYFFAAVLLAHSLLVAWRVLARPARPGGATERPWKVVGRWALVMGLLFLAYLPWLPIFLRQVGGRAGGDLSPGRFLVDAARWLVLGPTVEPGALRWAIAAAGFLALLALLPGKQTRSNDQSPKPMAERPSEARLDSAVGPNLPSRRQPAPVTLLILLALPPFLMLVVGATRPTYYKFMVVSAPFLALLLARGAIIAGSLLAGATARRRALQAAPFFALALLLGGRAGSLANLYYDPAFARDDYRGIAARIAAEGQTDAGVILNAANQWEVFTYYHREGAPVYPIPRGRPDAGRIAAELETIARRHDRLYALYWGEAERDPQQLVERWLDAHAYKAREEWVGDVRLVTYAVPREPATEMEVEAGARFGPDIILAGYTLQAETLKVGDILQVTLFWRAQEPVQARYKVFLHLVDQGGQLVAQRDAEPGGNLAPTTTWQPGRLIVDNHGLLVPPQTGPGRYALLVGLYPLDDPAARLVVQPTPSSTAPDAGPGPSDSYPLGSITVR